MNLPKNVSLGISLVAAKCYGRSKVYNTIIEISDMLCSRKSVFSASLVIR